MNKTFLAVGAASMLALVGCNEEAKVVSEEVVLDSLEKKVSYTIGVSVAQNVHVDEFAFDTAAFSQAVDDIKAGKEPQLNDDEMRATMQTFQTMQREIQMKAMQAAGAENLTKGEAFLTAKLAEEGVVATDSGLLYKVVTAGTGPVPKATDTVVAHYKGTLLDGTEFDSSYKRGQPATFPVGNLIPGWVEALQLMPVGSKWELYIPANLAYGENGNQGIPPNSTLIFELELIEIAAPAAPAEPGAAPAEPADAHAH